MKTISKKNWFKSAISIVLAVVVFLGCAFVFAGCDKEDDNVASALELSFFERYVGGFNTVFANDTSGYGGIDDNELRNWSTQRFNRFFFQQISAYFRDGNTDALKGENPDNLTNGTAFPDSVRFYAYETKESGETSVSFENFHWNWFISPQQGPTSSFLTDQKSWENLGETVKILDDWKDFAKKYYSTSYSTFFSSYLFQNILQIVIYEIMLGYDNLTEIEITYDPNKTEGFMYGFKVTSSNNSDLLNGGNYLYTLEDGTIPTQNNPISIARALLDPYSESLRQTYQSQTRYTGFTKDNADRLITYILDEVIGRDVVISDYNMSRNNETNYRNYVKVITEIVYGLTYDGSGDAWTYTYEGLPAPDNIVNFETTDENGIKGATDFSAKPATYVRYFPGETLFGEDGVEYQFTDKPIGEYQSILVVPARTATTLREGGIKLEAGFVFNFMSYNQNLKINAKVRYQYYNETTGYRKLFEFDCDQINFTDGARQGVDPDGKTYWENDFDFYIETSELPAEATITEKDSTGYKVTYYTIGFFDNDSLLNSVAGAEGGEVTLTEYPNIQDLYKVIASQNGFGGITVLNEKKINCSFFEIVLDVVKSYDDPVDTDYNFRLVLSNTALTPGIW